VSSVAEIEAAIAQLPAGEFQELLRRLNERDAADWDRQIEADSNSGKLDFLLKELSEDIAQGRMRPADEICGKPEI
jgi:hypothetical protein